MAVIILHQIRKYRIFLYAGTAVFLIMMLYSIYEDFLSLFLGMYLIYGFQMICPFLYLAGCAEERRITYLQTICTRVNAADRKRNQFVGELVILAEYMMLFAVLPALFSSSTSAQILSFLEYCLRTLMFISGVRLILIPFAGFAGASYLSAAIQITLCACNNWIFRGTITFLEMNQVQIIQWIIILFSYCLFLSSRRWNYE